MRETRPRNLKEMLVEAKNTSELMVDLSYAAIFYNSENLSEEVARLEERLNDLVYRHDAELRHPRGESVQVAGGWSVQSGMLVSPRFVRCI